MEEPSSRVLPRDPRGRPVLRNPRRAAQRPLVLPSADAGASNAASYLRHLHDACAAARALDTVKPLAVNADVHGLMNAPDYVASALAALGAPMSTLLAQKNLNVLGASPPLSEDGKLGPKTRAAIAALQAKFGQPVTGQLDSGTAVAIRYGVGCIFSQDRAVNS